MNKHREELLKLIKMINLIRKEGYDNYILKGVEESKADLYLSDDKIISIRELTRILIKELESEYMTCSLDDEIIVFIKNMIEWFKNLYDFVIEQECTDGIKRMKICNQLREDYENIYDKGKIMYKSPTEKEYSLVKFEFGKKLSSKVVFDKTGMTLNEGALTIVHNSEKILSAEYEKKIDEMHEWIKNQKGLSEKLSKTDNYPINMTINFTGDEKINQISIDKLKEAMTKSLKADNGRKYR